MSQDGTLSETEVRDIRMALSHYGTALDQQLRTEAEPIVAEQRATVTALVDRLCALGELPESLGWAALRLADFSAAERDVIRAALELRKQTTAQIHADGFPEDRLPIAMAVLDGYEQLIARFGLQGSDEP